jgi:proteasome-associated ATPase
MHEPSPESRLLALETALSEVRGELTAQKDHNQRLVMTLRDAREQIVALKAEVDRLGEPPSGYGTFIEAHEDGSVDVIASGRKLRVAVSPGVGSDTLVPGQEVVLNESMNIVGKREYETVGEIVTFKEMLGPERCVVVANADEERVMRVGTPLKSVKLRAGEALLCDTRSGYVIEQVPRAEVEELVLEEVPDIDYTRIGGLG